MKNNEIVLLNHQREFVESTEKEVVMLGGPATGKTFVQVIDCWKTAIRLPGIKQAYITARAVTGMDNVCRIICSAKQNVEFEIDHLNLMIRLKNSSVIKFSGYDQLDKLHGIDIGIYRFDLSEMFRVPRIYFDLLNRPWTEQMKITAWDASYRFMMRNGLKVIDAKWDSPEFAEYIKAMSDQESNKAFRDFLYGKWTEGEQPEPRREEPK